MPIKKVRSLAKSLLRLRNRQRGYQSFRLIPSSKLSYPMVFSHLLYDLYKVLAFCFLSILSVLYLCTVTFLFSFFVTGSDVLVRFSLFLVPYSFMVQFYVLGGPYLLCLDFMIYYFIGVYRCTIKFCTTCFIRFYRILLSYYLDPGLPLFLVNSLLVASYRFIPLSLYYDLEFF